MTRGSLADLLLLAALWGAAFLFMRTGAAAFGVAPLVWLRVAGACVLLLPLAAARGDLAAMRQHWKAIAIVGIVNSALPFTLFMTAALVLGAGLMAVFNATAPIFRALVAWGWLGERPSASRAMGLAVGLAGVVGLVWNKADPTPGVHGISPALAIAACSAAALLYGIAANVSKRHLAGVPPLAVAAGSQLAAALVMLLPAIASWPAVPPGAAAWAGAAALAFGCTGLAYVLYFRLIANAGAATAISVTLLIPAFALLWAWVFLAEQPTLPMLAGCAVILLGTALATGLLNLSRWG